MQQVAAHQTICECIGHGGSATWRDPGNLEFRVSPFLQVCVRDFGVTPSVPAPSGVEPGRRRWQAARLAAMLPRPQFYDRNRGSAYLAGYAERIQGRMGDAQLP